MVVYDMVSIPIEGSIDWPFGVSITGVPMNHASPQQGIYSFPIMTSVRKNKYSC